MSRINSRINFRIRILLVFEADFKCCFGACDPKVKLSTLSNEFISLTNSSSREIKRVDTRIVIVRTHKKPNRHNQLNA